MRHNRRNAIIHCSFCNKNKNQVYKIIVGNNVFICNECVALCNDIIQAEQRINDIDINTIPKPRVIYDILAEYVIGQDNAKKILSVAVYNHYKRVLSTTKTDGVEISKSNILLIGPTGCGKTLLAQTLARTLNVPFAIADATSLTEKGYIGDDMESVILKLLQATNFDVGRAEMGIVYIDEIDKISKKSSSSSSGRDISGEGVQQGLLKLVEGTIANVPQNNSRKSLNQESIKVDTTKILFICGGAFDGLENIIKDRVATKHLGFGADIVDHTEIKVGELFSRVENHDLVRYGLIPEFVGRFPVVATLEDMTQDAFISILTEPKNAIVKQYKALFAMDNIDFEVTNIALETIAKQAMVKKTGARGLRGIMEGVLLDSMFEVHESPEIKKLVLDSDGENISACAYDAADNIIQHHDDLQEADKRVVAAE